MTIGQLNEKCLPWAFSVLIYASAAAAVLGSLALFRYLIEGAFTLAWAGAAALVVCWALWRGRRAGAPQDSGVRRGKV